MYTFVPWFSSRDKCFFMEAVVSRKIRLSIQVSDHSQRDEFAGLIGGNSVGFQSPIAATSVNGLVLSTILLFLHGGKKIARSVNLRQAQRDACPELIQGWEGGVCVPAGNKIAEELSISHARSGGNRWDKSLPHFVEVH